MLIASFTIVSLNFCFTCFDTLCLVPVVYGLKFEYELIGDVSELNNWLINAFNGEWLRTEHAVPLQIDSAPDKK